MSAKNETLRKGLAKMAEAMNSVPVSNDELAWLTEEMFLHVSGGCSPKRFVQALRGAGWIISPPLVGITTTEPQESLQESEEEVKVGGSE